MAITNLIKNLMVGKDRWGHGCDVRGVVAGSRAVESGRMLIFFGGSGDLAYLQQLIDEEGFQREVLAQHSLVRNGWQVGYFTFRLTG
jgi:hypothetical protein